MCIPVPTRCQGSTEAGQASAASADRTAWIAEEPVVQNRRTDLPESEEPLKPFSLWSALKDLIGKDILDAPLPIEQYCPLSELQFRAEELEYTELLDKAASQPKGSMERLLTVAAFAQSGFAAGLRPYKCINPIMGETFEVVRPEKGMRAIFESVHQDYRGGTRFISAWQAEGADWTLTGEDEPRVRFWGSSVDLMLNWTVQVTFTDGERFSWRKGTSNISGLMSGNLVITHKGTLTVRAHQTGHAVVMHFKEPSMFSSKKAEKHEMVGHIEKNGKKLKAPTIGGCFVGVLYAKLEDGSRVELWQKRYPPNGLGKCQFSEWTAQLNEIVQGQRKRLCPTDSRLRPDVRALEHGRYKQAAELKKELSGRYRQATIDRQKGGSFVQPRWFALEDPAALTSSLTSNEEQRYRFTGDYWQARKTGKWENVPALFAE